MLRALLASALMLVPTAQAAVSVEEVTVPAQTVAGKVFDASVRLTNRGEPVDVVLAAALYDVEAGKECGPTTEPRFRGYTHLLHDPVHLGRDESLVYPPPSARWSHRYEVSETPVGGVGEWCVFVARAPAGSAQAVYEGFASTRLAVRAANAAPTVSFTWTPQHVVAAQPTTFAAEGADADGDPISYRWDFGFANASGQARAEGASPTVRFFPAGAYDVVVVASDGFDETRASRTVTVLAEDEGAAPTTVVATRADTPLPLWLALVGIGLAMARRDRRPLG